MVKSPAPQTEPVIAILRLTPGATKVVLSVAERFTGIQTHWTGRTMLCPGTDDCPGCLGGMETRWLGYLPVVHGRQVYALLEISAQAARVFEQAAGDGSLLNVALELQKGRRFEPLKILRSKVSLSDPPMIVRSDQVIDQIARILGLPRHRDGEPIEQWEQRLQTAASARLAIAARARS